MDKAPTSATDTSEVDLEYAGGGHTGAVAGRTDDVGPEGAVTGATDATTGSTVPDGPAS
jgi:hypothetical protein